MRVINRLKIIRKIEFISNQFSYTLRIEHFFPVDYTIKPLSYGHVAGSVILDENTASWYFGVIGFNIKNRIRQTFRYGTMMLFLPIRFMQFAQCTISCIFDIFFCVIFFNTEKNFIAYVIPKDPHFRFSIVKIGRHCINHFLMLFI